MFNLLKIIVLLKPSQELCAIVRFLELIRRLLWGTRASVSEIARSASSRLSTAASKATARLAPPLKAWT